MDDAAAKDEEGHHNNQGGERGEDGSTQGLVDTSVDDEIQGLFGVLFTVFSNSVKDNDGVVQTSSR